MLTCLAMLWPYKMLYDMTLYDMIWHIYFHLSYVCFYFFALIIIIISCVCEKLKMNKWLLGRLVEISKRYFHACHDCQIGVMTNFKSKWHITSFQILRGDWGSLLSTTVKVWIEKWSQIKTLIGKKIRSTKKYNNTI